MLASGRSWDQTKMAHNQLLLSVQQQKHHLSEYLEVKVLVHHGQVRQPIREPLVRILETTGRAGCETCRFGSAWW